VSTDLCFWISKSNIINILALRSFQFQKEKKANREAFFANVYNGQKNRSAEPASTVPKKDVILVLPFLDF